MDPSGHSGLDIFTPPSKYVHTGDIPVANDSNASYDITKKANTEAACSIINSYINDNQGAFMGVTAGVALVVLTAPASAPVLAVIGAGMAGGAVGMVIGGVLEKGISSADIARTLKTKYNIDVTERQNLDLDSLPSEVKDLCSQYDKNFEDMEGYFETGSVLMGLGVALYEAGYFLDSLQASIAEKSKKAYESLKNWFNKTFKGGSKGGSSSITNDILECPRTGSALKIDDVKPIRQINPKTGRPEIIKEFPATAQSHGFNDLVDNYAGHATKSQIPNGTLYQLDGALNGVQGRFEWIIQDGNVTHRMFIQNGTMNGVPIKP